MAPNASVEFAVVDLEEGLDRTLVLQELVHGALACLPDADAFVVPDLAVVHDLDDHREYVLVGARDDRIDHLRTELGQEARQLLRPDERLAHVPPDVQTEVTGLASEPPDVVVGAAKRATIRTRLVARVLLGRVVEFTDDPSPGSGGEVRDLLFIEQLSELVADEEDLALLLSCRCPVGPSSARLGHSVSRIA